MSDVGDRADDYEERLAASGSTNALVDGLTRSVQRNQRITGLLTIGVVMVVVLAVLVGGLAFKAGRNTDRVRVLFDSKEQIRFTNCLVNVKIIESVNALNVQLIEIEKQTKYTSAAEKDLSERRITARTGALLLPVPVCVEP